MVLFTRSIKNTFLLHTKSNCTKDNCQQYKHLKDKYLDKLEH